MTTQKPPRTAGELALQFDYQPTEQQTRLRLTKQTPPLRVIRAFPGGAGGAVVQLHNISGGILGGDSLRLTVTVDSQAQAQLTTPSATRVYKHRPGWPTARQQTEVTVGANGLLEYLPDSLIPFAQARYRQETNIYLHDGAGLFWWEILAPGREARQERFAYEILEMSLTIRTAQRPIVWERLGLRPAIQEPTSVVRFGPYGYSATFYICRVGWPVENWAALETELAQLGHRVSQAGEGWWGVSTLLAEGLVIRGVSHTNRHLEAGLHDFWQLAKQRLYNAPAIRPRKLY